MYALGHNILKGVHPQSEAGDRIRVLSSLSPLHITSKRVYTNTRLPFEPDYPCQLSTVCEELLLCFTGLPISRSVQMHMYNRHTPFEVHVGLCTVHALGLCRKCACTYILYYGAVEFAADFEVSFAMLQSLKASILHGK